ncbi:MAG: ATP-grasp domain-containing protein [Bacteroidota bacterium]
MRTVHWVLQQNVINQTTLGQIKKALAKDGISFEEVKIIPFSDELPEIKESEALKIFYGSTTLVLNAHANGKYAEGIFYDKEVFSMKNYLEKWGAHMLNHDSEILTFQEIVTGDFAKEDWFVRPILDDKSFSGRVMSFQEITTLEASLVESNNPYLNEKTLVLISKPKAIAKEWRHFIVDKEIVSSSRYAEFGHLSTSASDVPVDLLKFVNDRCQEYVPNDVFVMDVALCTGAYKIVECNCFNDTGFYRHDIEKIISVVNAYIQRMLSEKA